METIDFEMSDKDLWNYLCTLNSAAHTLCELTRDGGVGPGIIQDAQKYCDLRDSALKEWFSRMTLIASRKGILKKE